MLPLRASRPGSNGNKGVLLIPQSSSIRLFSVISRKFLGWSYPRDTVGVFCSCIRLNYSFRESYHSAEMQSMHSAALASCTRKEKENKVNRKDLNAHCLVWIIVKYPVFFICNPVFISSVHVLGSSIAKWDIFATLSSTNLNILLHLSAGK